MARNELSIRFSYMLDTAQIIHAAPRYVICQLEAGVIARERLCAFYAHRTGHTYDWLSRCNDAPGTSKLHGDDARASGLRIIA